VKKGLALAVLAAAVAGGAALVFQLAREQQYRALIAQGDTALREAQTFPAIEAYSGAIALRPGSMLGHLRRGEAYQQRGELEAATRDFKKAADLDPTAMRPREALGDVLYQRGRFRRAADVLESRWRLDDRSERVAYKRALAHYRDGNLQATLAALAQAIALNDRMADAFYLRGLCLRDQRNLVDAVRAFERALDLSPGLIPAREELADAFEALRRPADQLEQLQLLAGLDRDRAERHVALGLAHARAGRGELAVLTLGNALERTPDEPLLYAALGRVWLEMADSRPDAISKAIQALERAAQSSTASSELMATYGRALLAANQPEMAQRALHEAVQRFPVDPEAFVLYARVAEARSQWAVARDALLKHQALVPDGPDAAGRAAQIGLLSLRLNDPATGVVWLERAAARSPDVRTLAALADAQLRAGDRDAARATITRALDKEPADAALLALAARIGN
jgi:tetratricopeptide (TPR) repeat protein